MTAQPPTIEQIEALTAAIKEVYKYGAKDGKRNTAAEKRIAKSLAEATGWEAGLIFQCLDGVY